MCCARLHSTTERPQMFLDGVETNWMSLQALPLAQPSDKASTSFKTKSRKPQGAGAAVGRRRS